VTIGREEGNLLRLNDERASRFHAKVQLDNGEVVLTDLESVNGTRVNGNVVQIRRLRPGDRIGVGRSVLLFGSEQEVAARTRELAALGQESKHDEVWVSAESKHEEVWVSAPGADPPPDQAVPVRVLEGVPTGSEVDVGAWIEEQCRVIRDTLQDNHVRARLPSPLYQRIQQEVTTPDSPGRRVLAQGFHRLVVLDATRGLDAGGAFDVPTFLSHALAQLGAAFELDLADAQPEDVFQILNDEPRSLFCFHNGQVISENGHLRLRAFTQTLHQALMLFEVGKEEKGRLDALRPPGRFPEPLPPLPAKMTPVQAARLAELLDFLHRALSVATEPVAPTEDSTKVTLGYIEWQRLLAVQMTLGRYLLGLVEPEVLD
jgi:pSer/pThr/pTyr-binding forkhead associated (FHA) protein